MKILRLRRSRGSGLNTHIEKSLVLLVDKVNYLVLMLSLIWAPVPLWNYVGNQSPNKATKPLVRQSVKDWVAEGIYHDASDSHLFYHERWIRIDSFPYQENEVGGPADYERT